MTEPAVALDVALDAAPPFELLREAGPIRTYASAGPGWEFRLYVGTYPAGTYVEGSAAHADLEGTVRFTPAQLARARAKLPP